MTDQVNQKIEEYLTKLQITKKEELVEEMKYLKNIASNRMIYEICDEVNKVYNTKQFNPEKINEIISSSLEVMLKKYEKNFDNDLQNDEKVNENKIEDTIFEVTNKIITDINTHIKFRESLEDLNYGRVYHNVANVRHIRKIEDLEVYIRKAVKSGTNKLSENIKIMYDDILLEYNKKAKNFLDNVSMYKNDQQIVSKNESEFIDTPIKMLDPNGIFDDFEEYESENAKRFL